MKNGERVVLLHIRDALDRVIEYSQPGEVVFFTDVKTQDAILRRLEIVGEAVKRMSPTFREAHPHVPWRRIAGLRDVVVHHYDRVDLHAVWLLVEQDVPTLRENIARILAELES